MANEIILEAKNIYKSFSGVPVLQDVHFEVRKGEVHALMGENGAGKSTLIKIITGVYSKDAGSIWWEGKEVQVSSYADVQKLGIACIYQELSVEPPLTVAQNVFLGREPRKFGQGYRGSDPAVRLPAQGHRPGLQPGHRPAAAGRDPQGSLLRFQAPDHGRAHSFPVR